MCIEIQNKYGKMLICWLNLDKEFIYFIKLFFQHSVVLKILKKLEKQKPSYGYSPYIHKASICLLMLTCPEQFFLTSRQISQGPASTATSSIKLLYLKASKPFSEPQQYSTLTIPTAQTPVQLLCLTRLKFLRDQASNSCTLQRSQDIFSTNNL